MSHPPRPDPAILYHTGKPGPADQARLKLMKPDLATLLSEAEALKSDFRTKDYHTWFKHSRRHAESYARWKEQVLRLVAGAFGEDSRYYSGLTETEGNFSQVMPYSVFMSFLNVLKELEKRQQASEEQAAPESPVEPAAPAPAEEVTHAESQPEAAAAPPAEPAPAPEQNAAACRPPVQEPQGRPEEAAAPESAPEAAEPAPVPGPSASPLSWKRENKEPGWDPAEVRSQDAEAREVYSQLIGSAAKLLRMTPEQLSASGKMLRGACSLAALAVKNNPGMLNCAAFSTRENYLTAHTVNVLILSLAAGVRLRLDDADLALLALCSFFHDIGMSKYQDLYQRAERLSDKTFSPLTAHSDESAALVDAIEWLSAGEKQAARRVISQVHERALANGYPLGLDAEQIEPLAQIIGLADVYEALTHARPWRKAMHPYKAFAKLIEKPKKDFDGRILKAFIQVLSVYPPGSLVELKFGEVARVLRTREKFFSKPLVEILINTDGSGGDGQLQDLLENPVRQSVKRPLRPEDVKDSHPHLAGPIEDALWWNHNVPGKTGDQP